MIVKVLILAALVKLLLATNKPFLCSGIYAAVSFIFPLMTGKGFLVAIITGTVAFVLASIWFWLLNRFEDRPGVFWCIVVLGILLGFV